jgi:hypothetical protein
MISGVVMSSDALARTPPAPVVDSTFDVTLVVTLRDEAALRAYASHPVHRRVLETAVRPLVARYVVYDARLP